MATLFTTPFKQAISSLENKLRKKVQGISCAEIQANGSRQCIDETMAIMDLIFPTIDNKFTYTDGGSRGPYFVVLATVNYTGSAELLDYRPTNHFLKFPMAIVNKNLKTITFPCTIEQGQSKEEVFELATKELDFVNFYLKNLSPEWEVWKESVLVEVTKFINDKDATCKARSNFINSLNS